MRSKPRFSALLMFVLMQSAAWAGSPFLTGTTSLKTNIFQILAPVASIALFAVAAAAWVGKISWWWFVGVLIGVVIFFGADQIIAWVRAMSGV